MITRNTGIVSQAALDTSQDETMLSSPTVGDTVAGSAKPNHEAEITRLTWAVLDGKATNAERVRLAELVSAQHDERSMNA